VKRLVLLLLIITSSAFAAEKVTIEADNVESPEQSVFHAKGSVKVFQGEKTLLADEMYYYKDINYLHAFGNVKMTDNGNIMECDELEYDANRESGTFINADAFMPPYHWIKASKIDRHSPSSYTLYDARFSTCEGETPDWSFGASEANIGIGGYLSAWNTTARIKDFPFLYTPYFVYPIKTERESGFLVPNFGYNSNKGAFIQPQFFWNIDVDQDATFASLISANAPALQSLEHRLALDKRSNIETYFEYTDADKRYPEKDISGDNISEKQGRFFLYNKTNIKISNNFYFRAQIDAVSDYEYLDDYKNYRLLKEYDNDTDTYMTNIALSYFSPYSDIDFKYLDTMEYNVGTIYSKEHTYSAPRISFQKNITWFPVYIKYFAAYDNVRYTRYYYRYSTHINAMNDKQYQREHISFRFYKPVNMYIGTFTPSLTLYHTKWHDFSNGIRLPKKDTVSSYAKITSDENSVTRDIYMQYHIFKLNEIYKDYNGFKHSIYNTLLYKQIPRLNQRYLVNYIYDDVMTWTKEYTYTLSNYFTAKDWSVNLSNSQKYLLTKHTKRYEEFISDLYVTTKPFSMKIKHEYDRYEKDANYLFTGASLNLSPISLKASYLFDIDDYNTEDNNTAAEAGVVLTTKKYDLSYTRTLSGMNKNLSWDNLTDTTDTLAITYKKDCWAFGVSYIKSNDFKSIDITEKRKTEHTIMFTITLRGLGEYSSSLLLDKTEEDNPNEI